MAEQLMNELEKAAQVILAPPNLISTQQRRSAEEVFLNFRKTKCPYELCRQILETNTNDYILFEAAGLIKIALIREWQTLQSTVVSSLRQYLLHYVINKPNLAPYVRGVILQVIAIIIKSNSIFDKGKERQDILGEIENLIMTADLPRKLLGCHLISAIMQEFATNSKSTNIGLPWGLHFEIKGGFQSVDLKRIFKFSMGIVDELIKKDLEEDAVTLLKQLLPILENILTWSFLRDRVIVPMIELFQESGNPALNLTTDWQDIILVPAVLDLFFTLYWKVRGHPQLAYHARTCLVRLASLNGAKIPREVVELQYLSNYMERFLKLITSVDIIDQEAVGIANIIKTLLIFFKTSLYNHLPEDMFKSFLEQLSRLTCSFLENAAQEELSTVGDCLYTEALDALFDAWAYILSGKNRYPSEFYKRSSSQIFDIYLRCHLSPPQGIRNVEDKDLEKEEHDNEENDRERFKENLQIIGLFGRQVPHHSLPLLAQLIEDRISKLRENLNMLVGQTESLKNNCMIKLYEDIHWLVLIIGNILCMESDGEVALIPSAITTYDMEQVRQGKVDLNLTLQFLASSENISTDININTESVDHIIRLVADVFRLCAIEKTAISIHLDSILSPELSCTITWFLHKWSLHYLLPPEIHYFKISTTFIQAFGEDTAGASWAVNFLLEKVECNINAFKSEPALMNETINLLLSLVESPKKATYVRKSERFGNILNLATKGQYDFPQVVKRGLMQAVGQVAASVQNLNEQHSYWTEILQSLLDRLPIKQITSDEKFLQSYHQEEVKVQIIDILERLIGVGQGSQRSGLLFQHVYPVLRELPNLLSLYHNYHEVVELILELLCVYTKETVALWNLSETEAAQIYEICLGAIQSYTRCNANRLSADSTVEEDNYEDILLLMKLLMNIEDAFKERAVDAFLCGLSMLVPTMTIDLLKFPLLCSQYFKMITVLCELSPEKVLNLSPELLQPLLASVELGLFSFCHVVSTICCNIIEILAIQIYKDISNGRPRSQIMIPFLNVLITVVWSQEINSNLISSVDMPLYYLICCYQDEYQQVVQNILSTQTDQEIAERLSAAFRRLTSNIKWDTDHLSKNRFKKNFDRFITDVRGFLMVK
ncbi:exportin-4-like [Osmia bicornis bicornis]|uniref:exportin-4-like n=1 Tax=Osmia bicornis bicornis TaxID=1437191 RepID=UPI0010F95239|nr:exportin-4-like [Osmia bicornis bicornis]